MNKMPPIEKIHEAYSAIADGRVKFMGTDDQARVTSSDGAKEYTVTWNGSTYNSNDNSSYWQGYAGYPVIAVLMLQGKLTLDKKISAFFSGINWADVNREYKRNYAAAVNGIIEKRQLDAVAIKSAVEKVYCEIRELDITIRRGSLRPPKSQK